MGQIKRTKPQKLLAEVERYLAVDQPELNATLRGETVTVTGTYCVHPHQDDNLVHGCLDKFDIEVVLRAGFPEAEPVVRETGDKIPKSDEYHINGDGSCCLEIWETWLIDNPKATVEDFFDIPLRNFFLGQIQKAASGSFPHGEHDHGEAGLLIAYAEKLQCDPDKEVVVRMLRALKHSPPRGHWDCPCGSGNKVRNCCKERLILLSNQISTQLAEQMLLRLSI